MDRSVSSAPQYPAAMRAAGHAALNLLLSAAARERGEPPPAAQARPTVSGLPVLRQPQDGCRIEGEPETCPAVDAHPGHRSPLSQASLEPPGAGPRGLSV